MSNETICIPIQVFIPKTFGPASFCWINSSGMLENGNRLTMATQFGPETTLLELIQGIISSNEERGVVEVVAP